MEEGVRVAIAMCAKAVKSMRGCHRRRSRGDGRLMMSTFIFVSTRFESASVREDRTPTSLRIRPIALVVILVVLIVIYMPFIPIFIVHRMYGAHTVRVIAAADAAQITRSTAVQRREPTVVCDSTLLVVLVLR
jgi:hypothetical protein